MKKKILYVSGEESASQIKMRADRLADVKNPNCFLFTETSVEKILHEAKKLQPDFVIIDSIQTLQSQLIESSPGTVSQIRECSNEIIKFAKENNIPVFLVGHITKDGQIAGPKVLEHMVDVVLNFDGDRNHLFRLLRANKNRFGSTSEIGIYEMISQGLKEIKNPSEVLITKKSEELSGNSVAVTLEGNRPMLLEIQALVSTAVYGTPQRSSTGFDAKRLNMLLAVLEKRAGFQLGAKDVFLNITGGIKPTILLWIWLLLHRYCQVMRILPYLNNIVLQQKSGLVARFARSHKLNSELRRQKNWVMKRFLFPTSTKSQKENSELKSKKSVKLKIL